MTALKFFRIHNDLSQKTLATKTKIPRWKIALAETGVFSLSEREQKTISRFLKVPPERLLRPVHIQTEEECL